MKGIKLDIYQYSSGGRCIFAEQREVDLEDIEGVYKTAMRFAGTEKADDTLWFVTILHFPADSFYTTREEVARLFSVFM